MKGGITITGACYGWPLNLTEDYPHVREERRDGFTFISLSNNCVFWLDDEALRKLHAGLSMALSSRKETNENEDSQR